MIGRLWRWTCITGSVVWIISLFMGAFLLLAKPIMLFISSDHSPIIVATTLLLSSIIVIVDHVSYSYEIQKLLHELRRRRDER